MIEKSFREMVHNLGGKGASISPFDIVHKKKQKKKHQFRNGVYSFDDGYS